MKDTQSNHFMSTAQADYTRTDSSTPTPRRTYSEIKEEKLRRKAETLAPPYDQRTPEQKKREEISAEVPSNRQVRDPYRTKTETERRKLEQEIDETNRERMRYQKEAEQRKQRRTQEQHQDREMLKVYDPFGKPGGGAPGVSTGRTRFTDMDHNPQEAQDEGFFKFGRPGGGGAAPRDEHGRVRAQQQGASELRHGHGQKENRSRYNDPMACNRLGDELRVQIKERKEKEMREKQMERFEEAEAMKAEHYGKPGGGAPKRSDSGSLRAGFSMKDPGSLQKNDVPPQAYSYDPWGKGTGAPQRNANGRVINRKGFLSNPRYHDTKKVLSNISNGYDSPRSNRYVEKLEIYDPFGKGGGGAPQVDARGKPIAARTKNVYGFKTDMSSADQRRRQRAADELLTQQKERLSDNEKFRNLKKYYEGEDVGSDYATLMNQYKTGKPPVDPMTGILIGGPLKSSDITQSTVQPKHYNANAASRQYHDDLTRDAEERNMRRQLEKLKEIQEDKKHAEASDSHWGRPGGGAPLPAQTNKVNLITALHSPRVEDGRPYNKARDDNIPERQGPPSKQKYVRSTIPSNSSNGFEVSPESSVRIANYEVRNPYA